MTRLPGLCAARQAEQPTHLIVLRFILLKSY